MEKMLNSKIIGICGIAGSGKDTLAQLILEESQAKMMSFADPIKEFCARVFDWSYETLYGPSKLRNSPDHRYTLLHRVSLLKSTWLALRYNYNVKICRAVAYERYLLAKDNFLELVPDRTEEHESLLFQRFCECMDQVELTPRFALQNIGTEWGRECHFDLWVDVLLDRIIDWGLPKVVVSDIRFYNEAKAISSIGKVYRVNRLHSTKLVGETARHSSERYINTDLMTKYIHQDINNNGSIDELRETAKEIVEESF